MKTLQSYTKTTIYTRKTFIFLVYINKKQYLCRRKGHTNAPKYQINDPLFGTTLQR